jgi:hypothetical protein
MRKINDPLPSIEESIKETKKRLKIIKEIKPILESFAEAAILGGSVAYGKNYSVRKVSDIDLIILIKREEVDKIFSSGLCRVTPQTEESCDLFKKNIVDHFSIIKEIKGIDLQLHFWDKESHFKAELLKLPQPKVYSIWRGNNNLYAVDFSGIERSIKIDVKKYKYGDVHEYPSFLIIDGHFMPRQPLLNLITDPEILFSKDPKLLKNIDKIWENLAKKLIEESDGKVDLNKKSIINSMYGYWNMSKESYEKLEKRQIQELKKLGANL